MTFTLYQRSKTAVNSIKGVPSNTNRPSFQPVISFTGIELLTSFSFSHTDCCPGKRLPKIWRPLLLTLSILTLPLAKATVTGCSLKAVILKEVPISLVCKAPVCTMNARCASCLTSKNASPCKLISLLLGANVAGKLILLPAPK